MLSKGRILLALWLLHESSKLCMRQLLQLLQLTKLLHLHTWASTALSVSSSEAWPAVGVWKHASRSCNLEQCMCREQRQLNALVRQYLTVHGLKSTAMTLAEEAAGQMPSQDSLSSDLPTLVDLWQGRSEAGDARAAAEVMQHCVDPETVLP